MDKNINIEAEGGELILSNENGDHVIIPKKDREMVQGKIKEECHSCLDDYIKTLPTMEKYAEDGSVIPSEPLGPVVPEETKKDVPLMSIAPENVKEQGVKPFEVPTLEGTMDKIANPVEKVFPKYELTQEDLLPEIKDFYDTYDNRQKKGYAYSDESKFGEGFTSKVLANKGETCDESKGCAGYSKEAQIKMYNKYNPATAFRSEENSDNAWYKHQRMEDFDGEVLYDSMAENATVYNPERPYRKGDQVFMSRASNKNFLRKAGAKSAYGVDYEPYSTDNSDANSIEHNGIVEGYVKRG